MVTTRQLQTSESGEVQLHVTWKTWLEVHLCPNTKLAKQSGKDKCSPTTHYQLVSWGFA